MHVYLNLLTSHCAQCVAEGWSEKLKEQASEGCNIYGRVRVNKVVGNIHLSPGRSFRSSISNIYDLVPYLRDDGNRHDFSHTIHEFAFEGDDEYDLFKAKAGREMKQRIGIEANPLDGAVGRVSLKVYLLQEMVIQYERVHQTPKQQYMFQYFLKVVSTQFRLLEGKTVSIHLYMNLILFVDTMQILDQHPPVQRDELRERLVKG